MKIRLLIQSNFIFITRNYLAFFNIYFDAVVEKSKEFRFFKPVVSENKAHLV